MAASHFTKECPEPEATESPRSARNPERRSAMA